MSLLVDPEARLVEQLVLEQGRYLSRGTFGETLNHESGLAVLPDVAVDLSEFW